MPSPKKKKPIKKPAAKPSKAAAKPKTSKEKITSLLQLVPHHPAWADLNDPENVGRTWLVEFVTPPGVFMARSVPEPVDTSALNEEISASYRALFTGKPPKARYVLGTGWCGAHARRLVECLTRDVPNAKVPFSHWQLAEIDGTFRVVQ